MRLSDLFGQIQMQLSGKADMKCIVADENNLWA